MEAIEPGGRSKKVSLDFPRVGAALCRGLVLSRGGGRGVKLGGWRGRLVSYHAGARRVGAMRYRDERRA